MAHLDPVSQMCLGLTGRYFHQILHFCYGSGEKYNIRRNPFDLRMQVSVCGKYILNHNLEDWFLRDSKDIIWERSLGELLSEEKTLWGDLIGCGWCLTYKPEKAYERFAFEEEMFVKFKKEIEAFEKEDVEWYNQKCRRCRAKILLLFLEKEEEVFDGPRIVNEESLGLRREWKNNEEKGKALQSAKSCEEFDAVRLNYEPWEDVFRRLCI